MAYSENAAMSSSAGVYYFVPVQVSMVPVQALYWPTQLCQQVGQELQTSATQVSKKSSRSAQRKKKSAQSAAIPPTPKTSPVGKIDSADSIEGRVWTISQDADGCREVQELLEECDDQQQELIAAELRGHAWEALICPHANHVLQKCIMTMKPRTCQFIIDELVAERKVISASQLKYGCRIMQRLLEHCREDQMHDICEEILAHAVELSNYHYGSYVIQHLAEYGTCEQKRRLLELFQDHANTSDYGGFTCGVLAKALEFAEPEDSLTFAIKLIQKDGLIVRISRNRQGHIVAKAILEILEDHLPELESAVSQILGEESSLQTSRYGRAVINACRKGRSVEKHCEPQL